MSEIIGWLMLIAAFIALLLLIAFITGFAAALGVVAFAAFATVWIVVGVNLVVR